jgi:hypothetical protein
VSLAGVSAAEASRTNVDATNVDATHVNPANVAAANVAATEVTAASMSATSVTAASTTSKGRCRDCSTAQKDSGDGYEQCFTQHQDLHHRVSSTKPCRRNFPSPRDLQDDPGQRQIATCAMRKSRASAAGASNFGVRLGSPRYRRAIPQAIIPA